MPTVMVIGSVNIDYSWRVEQFPQFGMTTRAELSAAEVGGKGLNQARALRRLGVDVRFVCGIGKDSAGDRVRQELAALGIEATVFVAGSATGQAFVVVDAQGQNFILVDPGANAALPHEFVLRAQQEHRGSLLLQMETPPDLVEAVLQNASGSQRIYLDGGPLPIHDVALLSRAFVYSPNLGELGALTDMEIADSDALLCAIDRLRGQIEGDSQSGWPMCTLFVKMGRHGSVIVQGDGRCLLAPAMPIAAVDATGAGDVYLAALAATLETGSDALAAARFANCAAGLSAMVRGVANACPGHAEVMAELAVRETAHEWMEPLELAPGLGLRLDNN
ncbi:MAG: PfkB family carbohydrate kinase [Bacilli bacterium]